MLYSYRIFIYYLVTDRYIHISTVTECFNVVYTLYKVTSSKFYEQKKVQTVSFKVKYKLSSSTKVMIVFVYLINRNLSK